MVLEANKRLMQQIMEAINTKQLDALDGHPDLWETRQVMPLLHTMFTDWQTTSLVQIAEDDRVFSYGAFTARHVGQFAGVAATDRRFPIEVFSLDRVVDGKIVNHNSASTWYDIIHSLGVSGFEGWAPRATSDFVQLQEQQRDRSTLNANKALIDRLLTALGDGDERAMERHDGVGALADEFRAMRAAFPDLRYTLVAQIAENDLVGTRATLRGTHTGPLYGLRPTGKAIIWDVFSLDRVVEGTLVAHHGTPDWNAALEQLGIFTVPMNAPRVP